MSAIAYYCRHHRLFAWPGQRQLVARCKLSETTLRRTLRELERGVDGHAPLLRRTHAAHLPPDHPARRRTRGAVYELLLQPHVFPRADETAKNTVANPSKHPATKNTEPEALVPEDIRERERGREPTLNATTIPSHPSAHAYDAADYLIQRQWQGTQVVASHRDQIATTAERAIKAGYTLDTLRAAVRGAEISDDPWVRKRQNVAAVIWSITADSGPRIAELAAIAPPDPNLIAAEKHQRLEAEDRSRQRQASIIALAQACVDAGRGKNHQDRIAYAAERGITLNPLDEMLYASYADRFCLIQSQEEPKRRLATPTPTAPIEAHTLDPLLEQENAKQLKRQIMTTGVEMCRQALFGAVPDLSRNVAGAC